MQGMIPSWPAANLSVEPPSKNAGCGSLPKTQTCLLKSVSGILAAQKVACMVGSALRRTLT